ncbi:MAG: MBL fold metallo-hydrolase [Vicinamibacterales bacterium]
MDEVLLGFSRAMYANWLWHRPLQLIIDAGEGLQLALSANVFSPSYVAITHGHSDHVLGLPGLIAARRFGKGANDKPLHVIYPDGSRGVTAVRELLGIAYAGVVFPVSWIGAGPGFSRTIGKGRSLEAFGVTHTADEPALGYRVVETRRRLRAEFAHLSQGELETLALRGQREEMLEDIRHVVFAHSGDAMPIDPNDVRGADLLVHDATFLEGGDRREPIHATTEEAFDVACAGGVKKLLLYHLSVRYDRTAAVMMLRRQLAKSGFDGECWWLDEDAFVDLRR